MITIVAEKPDVGNKIAAALDKIMLSGGKVVLFKDLKANEKAVRAQQAKDGFLKISFMGQDCYVTWGFGHLCELKQAKDYNPDYKKWRNIPLPYKPNPYQIQLQSSPDEKAAARTKKQFEIVKRLMCSADVVINATDFDREGEVIFAYIYQLSKCKTPVKRACFTSQTESGIKKAFSDLKNSADFKDIEQAGRMRNIADWVVGINLTVAMSLKSQSKTVFSVGRVQTPTLAIVVKRELEIRSFKATPYWNINAEFKTARGELYKAKHHVEKFTDVKAAESVFKKIEGNPGEVTSIEKKRVSKDAPLLYSLSALQMEANAKFGFTLDHTLEIAQKLYDDGHTTYPRTKSQYLTEDMEPEVNKVLDALKVNPVYDKLITGRARKFDRRHYFDNSKVESHFAIIPTDNVPTALSADESKVYDLICRSVISMLYGDAILEQTKIVTSVAGEDFHSSGSMIIDAGWMAVRDASKEEFLPVLSKGDVCSGSYKLNSKQTKAPERYTDKSLLTAMLTAGKTIDDAALRKILSDPKTGGIGTEATRANIVKMLVKRGFIERKGKSLWATDEGIQLIKKLPLEAVKSAELTARWEQRLNDIACGKEKPDEFLRDIENTVDSWVEEINLKVLPSAPSIAASNALGVNCPICGKPMEIKSWGYGCSGWSSGCKFSIGKICEKKITANQAKMLIIDGKTPLINGFMSKSGRPFSAFLKLEAGRITFEFPPR